MNFENSEIDNLLLELLFVFDKLAYNHHLSDDYSNNQRLRTIAKNNITDSFQHVFLNVPCPGIEYSTEFKILKHFHEVMEAEGYLQVCLDMWLSDLEDKMKFMSIVEPFINGSLNNWLPAKEETESEAELSKEA